MRDSLLRWCGPAVVALLLAVGSWLGLNAWARHQAQHALADQDHLLLQQVVQVLNQRLAPPQAPR